MSKAKRFESLAIMAVLLSALTAALPRVAYGQQDVDPVSFDSPVVMGSGAAPASTAKGVNHHQGKVKPVSSPQRASKAQAKKSAAQSRPS